MNETVREGILKSQVFFVFGTQNYMDDIDGELKEQIAYAKELKKPFRILLDKGVTIPDKLLEGVVDYKIVECDINNKEFYQEVVLELFGLSKKI